jgi:hypothetical protein
MFSYLRYLWKGTLLAHNITRLKFLWYNKFLAQFNWQYLFVHVDGITQCLWTVATSEPIIHPPGIYESGKPWWNDIDRGKPKNLEKNLSQWHFIHPKFQME